MVRKPGLNQSSRGQGFCFLIGLRFKIQVLCLPNGNFFVPHFLWFRKNKVLSLNFCPHNLLTGWKISNEDSWKNRTLFMNFCPHTLVTGWKISNEESWLLRYFYITIAHIKLSKLLPQYGLGWLTRVKGLSCLRVVNAVSHKISFLK